MAKRPKDTIRRSVVTLKLNKELMIEMRVIAAREEKGIYEVFEEAMVEYLKKKHKSREAK